MRLNLSAFDVIDATVPVQREDAHALLNLLSTRYSNARYVLEDVLAHSTQLFVARDAHGISAMHAIRYEELDLGKGSLSATLYLGASATRGRVVNKAPTASLYLLPLMAAARWERERRRQLTVWGTTARPSVFRGLRRVLDDVMPRHDGTYDPDFANVAARLWERLGATPIPFPGEHPFVRRRLLSDVEYLTKEADQMERANQRAPETILRTLDLDGPRGDRLLFIGRLRQPPGLDRRDRGHEISDLWTSGL